MTDINEIQLQTEPSVKFIGRCIYCGSIQNLSDEHILPRGLKGIWQLQKASCPHCAKITSSFEQDVLRKQFNVARSALKLPSYKPKNRPKEFTFSVIQDGEQKDVSLPAADSPPVFMMLHLKPPRYITNGDYEKGAKQGVSLHGPSKSDFREKWGFEAITFETKFKGTSFERMLAKIAYGFFVHQNGLGVLKECFVLPCILGQKDDAGYWVGASWNKFEGLPKTPYFHTISLFKNGNEVAALIRLFASFGTPEYAVIIGKV